MVEFLRNAKDRKGSRAAREREKSPVKEEEEEEEFKKIYLPTAKKT